jgi:hypothetical protein
MLGLLIVLTGQAAAVAHAAPGPSGQIELCTGAGPVMVYLDADGEPVGPPVYCPDFALSLILALDAAPDLPVLVRTEGQTAEAVPVAQWMPATLALIRLARGPPTLI